MHSKTHPIITLYAISVAILLMTFACGEQQKSAPAKKTGQSAGTFTFFDVNSQSRFSKSLRRDLKKILGDDAIESRNVIDLEAIYKGFLKNYFPDVDAINRQLNSPLGERIDHNTVKLMYRYARKKNVPFDYIEIVFSKYSDKPLLIKIRFKTDEADTVNNLELKYGPPKSIDLKTPKTKALFWRKDEDLLLVSMVPDQIGIPRYRIAIYYTQNLKELIKTEELENKAKQQQKTKSGRTAF